MHISRHDHQVDLCGAVFEDRNLRARSGARHSAQGAQADLQALLSPRRHGKQGSGIGLAIARRAAEAHGGSLDLKSSEGVGNVFTLRLPQVERVVVTAVKM